VRTESFKRALLSALVAASIIALAIPLLPTDRASALSEETKISIKVDFPAPEITKVGEYHRVTMSGLQSFGNPGEPILPLSTVRVLVPYGREVRGVRVFHEGKVTLDGSYRVEPAQMPVPLSSSESIEPTPPDERIYNSSHPFPARIYSNPLTQSKRGYQILILNLYPVSYLPAEGELSYFEYMIVEVEFRSSPLEGLSVRCSSEDKQEIRRMVDNPEAIDSYPQVGPLASENEYKYVIITSEGLKNYSGDYDWQVLCDRKEFRGITTNIVTLDWIYSSYSGVDNPEKIRNFIKYAYDNWGTEYVLLGGDDTVVPFRRFWVEAFDPDDNMWYTANMPSDMYYSCLDGTFNYDNDNRWGEPNDGEDGGEVDFYAEVYVGRAPVASGVDVSNFVHKTLAFENFVPEDRYLAYMVGEYLGWGGLMDYAKPSLEEIRLGSDAYGYTTEGFVSCGAIEANTLYEADGDWDHEDNVQPLIDAMNGGIRVVNHLGHGSIQYVMGLSNSDLDNLTNTETEGYFFIYSQTCSAGHFDGFECWAEKVVRMENGATAVVMNARYGFGNADNTDGPSQHFAREFWDAVFGEKKYNLGVMNSDSKEDQDWYISLSSRGRWCAYELNLFGDPELHIIPLSMPHDPIYIVGNDNFTPANGVVGGSGTENDPYIIEKWDIDASSANGIEIRNTTAYFIIRNCYVYDGQVNYNRGIYLDNVKNGKIDNNNVENNYYGIHLRRNSGNNLISNNLVENNNIGIWLYLSDNNLLFNNLAGNNHWDGIRLENSNNNLVSNNLANNSGYGIILGSSDNNLISNNIVRNSQDGIYFYSGSDNNIVENNLVENSWLCGIYLHYSDYNLISNNLVENNIYKGISLYFSDYNLISNNIVRNSWLCGIYLGSSDNNLTHHNNIMNNENQAYDDGTNYWDNGYPSGGNYWSDYTGVDENQGENQDIPGSDGIGDTPYYIPVNNNWDRYPLMYPWPVSGTAVFSLENLYKVRLEIDLWLYAGSKLVLKFCTYGDAYENENVIETFTPSARVEENVDVPHPQGRPVEKARLDLTTDNTEDVISTIATFTVDRNALNGRITAIYLEWPFASPERRNELNSEIVGIYLQWPFAPR